jgi:hypothetical protein
MKQDNKILFNSLIIIFFLFHIIFINFYPVNFEFAFIESSSFIKEGFDKEIANRFFNQQANSFFFSFLISLLSFILPVLKPIYIGKILSASSIILIGLAAINLKKSKLLDANKYFNKNLFLIFIILNPLIWVFSYRATPDVFSSSLAFYGFSLALLHKDKLKYFYLAGLIMGLASALKIITGIYFLLSFILLINFGNLKKNINNYFLFCFYYSIIPIIFYSIIFFNFQFFLFSPYYKSVLTSELNIKVYLNNFILYLSFLFIFLSPVLILKFIKIFKKKNLNFLIINILIYLLLYFIGYNLIKPSVEMTFGIFSNFINNNILNGILLCCSYTFICILYGEVKFDYSHKNFFRIKITLIILLYLLIISFSLPSQRYLIIILPICYYLFSNYYFFNPKIGLIIMLSICIPVNSFLMLNQYLTGSASKEITRLIKKKGMINDVCYGAIGSHSAHEFPNDIRDDLLCARKDFHIIKGEYNIVENIIISVHKKFFLISKKYHLIKIR